jgi:hypothetical protein
MWLYEAEKARWDWFLDMVGLNYGFCYARSWAFCDVHSTLDDVVS